MEQKGIASGKIVFLNFSDKTCSRVKSKMFTLFQTKIQMLIPKTALFEFSLKSEKNPKGTTLCFGKKI